MKRRGDWGLEIGDFLFAEFEAGQEIEVLRAGSFVDRNGREVEVTEEDLDAYVANFEAGEAGQEVPVDVDHEKGEAAGWIQGLQRKGDTLVAVPEWNELGRRLVGERIYRYLSATIDLARKVVKSISLVNFPAVKGLKAVELSEGVFAIEETSWVEGVIARVATALREALGMEGGGAEGEVAEFLIRQEGEEWCLYSRDGSRKLGCYPTKAGAERRERQVEYFKNESEGSSPMTDEERATLREELRVEILAEMAENEKTVAELREEIRAEVAVELREQFERRAGFVEFAKEVCGGEVGLSAKPEDVVSLLEGLDEDLAEQAKALLKSKVVDFGERGSSQDGKGKKQAVPGEVVEHLRAWVAAGNSVEEFFRVNVAELGEMDDFDVSEFVKEE